MDLSSHINFAHLSHAYVIEGPRELGLHAIRTLVESFGIPVKANPDFHELKFETFTIDDAHELRHGQGMHGASGAKKIFIVAFNAITIESQNALLKTLEEPTENTHFFFLVRTSSMLLPTVRSRMQLIRSESGDEKSILPFAQKFLDSPISERIKMIEPLTKAKIKDEDKAVAKEQARVLVESLEVLLYSRLPLSQPSVARALEDILYAKRELVGRSPSVKILLQHLALIIPVAQS